MLAPKKVKYLKSHKISTYGKAKDRLSFGEYGIQAQKGGRITAQQIEAARKILSKEIKSKKEGKLWIRIFPDKPLTRKPNEVRMGKGKGGFHLWYTPIKENQIIFEFNYTEEEIIKEMNRKISSKLPFKTNIIKRNDKI